MSVEKTLILRRNIDDYFFPVLKDDYNIYSTFQNKMDRFIFSVHDLFKIKETIITCKWARNIEEFERVILFDYGWERTITSYIKRINPNIKIHLFYFNTIHNKNHYAILKDKNIDTIWTFDPGDVKKYDIKYATPMYTKKMIKNIDCECKNDVVFVGASKNRCDTIAKIEKMLMDMSLTLDFNVIKNKDEYISYNDYIEKINNSKCVLDITLDGQQGLTLRFMEGLFLEKKIITNNPEVKKYDFYDSNNIFILGVDDIDTLQEFIYSPFEKKVLEYIDYYDFQSWIERFK